MRALCDTNVLVSYLLLRSAAGSIALIVRAAFAGAFTLLLPEELLNELTTVTHEKPYLSDRIRVEAVARLKLALLDAAELLPPLATPIPLASRDPKDNYLLAYALAGQADYLVTGDRDLLTLGSVGKVTILTPAEFALLLQQAGQP